MIFTSFHIDHSTKDQLYLLDVVSLSRYLFMASLRLAFTISFRYFSKSCYPFLYWISLLNEVVLEELFGHRHIPRAAYTTRWAMRNHFHFSTRDVARFPSTPIHTWHASTFLWICAVRPGLLWMAFSLFVTTISHKAFLSDSYGFCGRNLPKVRSAVVWPRTASGPALVSPSSRRYRARIMFPRKLRA